MPIGTLTFHPYGQCAFPRSYIWGTRIKWAESDVVYTDNKIDVYNPSHSILYFTLKLDERFRVWSSNRWTLDHLLTDAYYTSPPSPTLIPLDVTVSLFYDNPLPHIIVEFSPFGLGDHFYSHALPPSPTDYWAPPEVD